MLVRCYYGKIFWKFCYNYVNFNGFGGSWFCCLFGDKTKKINLWGRRIAVLALFGLALCCFVATRDNYHLSVQSSFDQTVSAGLFTLESIQSTVCSIGGAIIALASISSIFVKKQRYRKIMFFIIGVTMLVKTLVIEISRGVML